MAGQFLLGTIGGGEAPGYNRAYTDHCDDHSSQMHNRRQELRLCRHL
jgi:hypothetical protein